MKTSVLEQPTNSILAEIETKIDELIALGDDWDGENTYVPDEQVKVNALLLVRWILFAVEGGEDSLRAVSISALSHGTIYFAWYSNGKKALSFEIGTTSITCFIAGITTFTPCNGKIKLSSTHQSFYMPLDLMQREVTLQRKIYGKIYH
jgi:hypothetical protein